MKHWKVWFYLGPTRFAIEFTGDFNFVCESATMVAKKFGAGFDYDVEEIQVQK